MVQSAKTPMVYPQGQAGHKKDCEQASATFVLTGKGGS
jgi:hypothetical protein